MNWLDVKFYLCKTFGHRLIPLADARFKEEKFVWFKCERCERDYVQKGYQKQMRATEKEMPEYHL
jgi:hypothetical protein